MRVRAIRNGLTAAGAAALLTVTAAADAAPKRARDTPPERPASEHIYYDVSEKPDQLTLLALTDSGKVGRYYVMDVIDVMRSPRMMLGMKWRIDCAAERMGIIELTMVKPGSPVRQRAVTQELVSTHASKVNEQAARLGCSGEGDLVEQRVHRGRLDDIARRFWAD